MLCYESIRTKSKQPESVFFYQAKPNIQTSSSLCYITLFFFKEEHVPFKKKIFLFSCIIALVKASHCATWFFYMGFFITTCTLGLVALRHVIFSSRTRDGTLYPLHCKQGWYLTTGPPGSPLLLVFWYLYEYQKKKKKKEYQCFLCLHIQCELLFHFLKVLVLFTWPCCVACSISVPRSGIEPGPWQWKLWVLTTTTREFPSHFISFNIFSLLPSQCPLLLQVCSLMLIDVIEYVWNLIKHSFVGF